MNQLATAMKKLNQGKKDLAHCDLTPLEVAIISNLMNMSSEELNSYLQSEEKPTDWLMPSPIKIKPLCE